MDDDDDDDDEEAIMRGMRMTDADAGGCSLTVPAVGITLTVSPPSPDCSPGCQPPLADGDSPTGIIIIIIIITTSAFRSF